MSEFSPVSSPVVSPLRLAPGDPIEVQNRFDGTWCGGFEIAEVLGSPPRWSYRIRRLSDGELLPRVFEHDAIVPDPHPSDHPAVPGRLAS